MRARTPRPIGLIVLVGLVLTACAKKRDAAGGGYSPAEQQSPGAAPQGATVVTVGGQLFGGTGRCFTCHGSNAKGTSVAPDLTGPHWIDLPERPTQVQVAELIGKGVPAPKRHVAPMPPMGGANLTPEQIDALAAYVLDVHRSGG